MWHGPPNQKTILYALNAMKNHATWAFGDEREMRGDI
jgi:hypothetical protein